MWDICGIVFVFHFIITFSVPKWPHAGLMVHFDMVKLVRVGGGGPGGRAGRGGGAAMTLTLAPASQISHLIPPHDVSLRKSPDQSKCTPRQWQVTEPRGAVLTEQIPPRSSLHYSLAWPRSSLTGGWTCSSVSLQDNPLARRGDGPGESGPWTFNCADTRALLLLRLHCTAVTPVKIHIWSCR